MQPYIAFDTETTGFNLHGNAQVFAFSACNHEGETWYWEWPVKIINGIATVQYKKSDLTKIRKLLQPYKTWVLHNAKFDVRGLVKCGILSNTANTWNRIQDTLASSHVLDSLESHGLKDLALKYFNFPDVDEAKLKETVKLAIAIADQHGIELPSRKVYENYWLPKYMKTCVANYELLKRAEVCSEYAINDAVRTSLLYQMQYAALRKEGLLQQYQIELEVIAAVYEMESRGIPVDPKVLESELKRHTAESTFALDTIQKIAYDRGWPEQDFNPGSNKQMAELLYDPRYFSLPIIKRTAKAKKPSADKSVIEKFLSLYDLEEDIHDFFSACQTFRDHDKARSALQSYVNLAQPDPYSKRGLVLFSNINPQGTDDRNVRTTRFSSDNPNTMQVGKRKKHVSARKIFRPRTGFNWWSFDYSQLEFRILGTASQDENILRAFENDEDLHQLTATKCGIDREPAKTINYGIIYGLGNEKADAATGILDFKDSVFFPAFPKIGAHMNWCQRQVYKYGYILTLMGYRLYVDKNRAYAGLNYEIQGSAGGILKRAIVDIRNYIRYNELTDAIYILIPVHDELDFEAKKTVPKYHMANIAWIMELAGRCCDPPIYTPVDTSFCNHDWGQAMYDDSAVDLRKYRKPQYFPNDLLARYANYV